MRRLLSSCWHKWRLFSGCCWSIGRLWSGSFHQLLRGEQCRGRPQICRGWVMMLYCMAVLCTGYSWNRLLLGLQWSQRSQILGLGKHFSDRSMGNYETDQPTDGHRFIGKFQSQFIRNQVFYKAFFRMRKAQDMKYGNLANLKSLVFTMVKISRLRLRWEGISLRPLHFLPCIHTSSPN